MKSLLIGGVVLALAGLAGCGARDNGQVNQQVAGVRQTINQAAQDASRAAADASLASKVKSALENRKGMNAKDIDVDAKAGTVTLKGNVAAPDQARLAEETAMQVEGVNTVQNQLTMRVPALPEQQTGTLGTAPGGITPAGNAPATGTGTYPPVTR